MEFKKYLYLFDILHSQHNLNSKHRINIIFNKIVRKNVIYFPYHAISINPINWKSNGLPIKLSLLFSINNCIHGYNLNVFTRSQIEDVQL